MHYPVLPFLVFFWKMARETTKKTRIFYPYRTPKIPGKEGKKTLKKTRNSLHGQKARNSNKKKGKFGALRMQLKLSRRSMCCRHRKPQYGAQGPELICADGSPERWKLTTPQPEMTQPKGPFRTKNSTEPESVVFCYRRSFSLSVPFSCLFFLEKQALQSTIRSVLFLP